MAYKVGDRVVFVSEKHTKYKYVPEVDSVGTVLSFNKRGVLVQWAPRENWDGVGWCRFGEVRKRTSLDEFFSEFD